MNSQCPDCGRTHDDPRIDRERDGEHAETRCPECLAKAIAAMKDRTDIPSPNEAPRPPEFYSATAKSEPPSRSLPPLPRDVQVELHKPTAPGVLPSQPDGLTHRQREAQKSKQ